MAGTCPLKSTPVMRHLGPHLVHGFLDPREPDPQTTCQLVQPFLHNSPMCPTDHTQTTLHATSVVRGHIYAPRAGDADKELSANCRLVLKYSTDITIAHFTVAVALL